MKLFQCTVRMCKRQNTSIVSIVVKSIFWWNIGNNIRNFLARLETWSTKQKLELLGTGKRSHGTEWLRRRSNSSDAITAHHWSLVFKFKLRKDIVCPVWLNMCLYDMKVLSVCSWLEKIILVSLTYSKDICKVGNRKMSLKLLQAWLTFRKHVFCKNMKRTNLPNLRSVQEIANLLRLTFV